MYTKPRKRHLLLEGEPVIDKCDRALIAALNYHLSPWEAEKPEQPVQLPRRTLPPASSLEARKAIISVIHCLNKVSKAINVLSNEVGRL